MIANANKIWDAMTDDQRETYGKDYVSNTLGDDEGDRTKPKPNIQAVPLAIEKALFMGNPKNTYIVSGDTGLIDASTVSCSHHLSFVCYFACMMCFNNHYQILATIDIDDVTSNQSMGCSNDDR